MPLLCSTNMSTLTLNDAGYVGQLTQTGIVREGMVLHLDPGNRNSYRGVGTTVIDLTGKGYNGTLSGGLTWSPLYGGVWVHDGTNKWVDTALSIDANPNTICAWFYCTDVASANGRGVVLTDNGGWDKGFGTVSSQWEIHVGDNQGVSSTRAPQNGLWYFGTCTYDNTNVILYINGANAVYTKGSGPGATSGEPVEIGRAWYNGGGGSRFWAGYISSVQIYNRVITAAEINQNWNAMKGRFGI